MALVFVPTMGTLIGKPGHFNEKIKHDLLAAETGDLYSISGLTGKYIGFMSGALKQPWSVFIFVTLLLIPALTLILEDVASLIKGKG